MVDEKCDLILFGDLNYRVDLTFSDYTDILGKIKEQEEPSFNYLLEKDQYRLYCK